MIRSPADSTFYLALLQKKYKQYSLCDTVYEKKNEHVKFSSIYMIYLSLVHIKKKKHISVTWILTYFSSYNMNDLFLDIK